MFDRLASLKIGPGDRVAALLPNSPFLIELLFATWRLGATFCPLNARLPPAQVQECLERLNPTLYVTAEGFFPMEGEKGSEQPSAFLFTSGSTGRPKIAVLSEKSLRANARAAAEAVGLRKEDMWLLSLPLYHVSGIGVALRCEAVGAKVAFAPDRSVTHISSVQAQLYRALPVTPRLKCLLLGGGPIGPIPERLPVYGTYGLTEMGSMVTVQKDPVEKGGIYYLGKPLEGREVRVAEDGEVWVRGECLFEGYWENGRIEKKGEWFGTKDIGVWCEKKGLGIIGRKDRQFISGGENIQPEEIERVILGLIGVEGVVVLPQPSEEFGQRPVAWIKGAVDLQKTKKALRELLPKYKIPVEWHLTEDLPRTKNLTAL